MPKKELKHHFPALFLLFFLLCSSATGFSFTNFALTDSNQGAYSDYIFSFTPSLSHDLVEAIITFPIEYSVS